MNGRYAKGATPVAPLPRFADPLPFKPRTSFQNRAIEWATRNLHAIDTYPGSALAQWMLRAESRGSANWWRRFGQLWATLDFFDCHAELAKLLRTQPIPAFQMMTPNEIALLNQLPEELTLYRGCRFRQQHGFSWSLKREKAAEYARAYSRILFEGATVLSCRVSKDEILALKDLDLLEVIVLPERTRAVTHVSWS